MRTRPSLRCSSRYTLVVTYAVIMGALFILPYLVRPLPFIGVLWSVAMIVALVLQYLAWGMPAGLRRYLNRNYHPSTSAEQALDMTEKEVLRALGKQAR